MKIKNKLKQIISFLLVAFMLQACADQGGPINKEQFGTVLGGIGGAILGSQVGKGEGQLVGTAFGALAGAAIGNSIGSSMDKADLAYSQRTTQMTLERATTGQTMEWRNPDSGNFGTVTPTKTFQMASGEYCREYTQTINVGGQKEKAYGRACRQPDGSWKIID